MEIAPPIIVWSFIIQFIVGTVLLILDFFAYKLEFPYEKLDLTLLEIYVYALYPIPLIGAVSIVVGYILLLLKIKWHKQTQQGL